MVLRCNDDVWVWWGPWDDAAFMESSQSRFVIPHPLDRRKGANYWYAKNLFMHGGIEYVYSLQWNGFEKIFCSVEDEFSALHVAQTARIYKNVVGGWFDDF